MSSLPLSNKNIIVLPAKMNLPVHFVYIYHIFIQMYYEIIPNKEHTACTSFFFTSRIKGV